MADVVDEVAQLGADAVSLQTCFIGAPDRRAVRSLERARGRLEVALAWGAPEGIRYGADADALDDLLAWLAVADEVGVTQVRIVLGGPAQRGAATAHGDRTVAALRVAAGAARAHGLRLAIENHGDISATDLLGIVERVDDDCVGVCFDTANALRVGDEVVAAAELLAAHVTIVHLKDIEDPAHERDPIAGPCSVEYGSGVVPLAATLATLRRGGFDDLVCIEIGQVPPGGDECALARSGLAWLAHADV